MAKVPDPLTDTRRQRLRAYCRSHGLGSDGAWQTGSIAQRIAKPVNKTSDLLNGQGSFGAKIAREIEAALGLASGYLDAIGGWPFVLFPPEDYELIAPAYRQRIENELAGEIQRIKRLGNGKAA